MAAKADEVFNLPIDQINSSFAWIGILSYTFQIYFDFSGYSDMAIGIGHMFNVKVKNVCVVNVKGKRKRFKQLSGKRSDWKKAFVSLHKDYDIDFTVTE